MDGRNVAFYIAYTGDLDRTQRITRVRRHRVVWSDLVAPARHLYRSTCCAGATAYTADAGSAVLDKPHEFIGTCSGDTSLRHAFTCLTYLACVNTSLRWFGRDRVLRCSNRRVCCVAAQRACRPLTAVPSSPLSTNDWRLATTSYTLNNTYCVGTRGSTDVWCLPTSYHLSLLTTYLMAHSMYMA